MAFAHGFKPDSMAAYYAELDCDYDDDEPELKICNRCGVVNLHWQDTEHGWRLFDDLGAMHSCDNFKPSDLSNLKRKS